MSLTQQALKVDKEAAKEALLAYRQARAPATDEDRAIMTAYREIARGRKVICAIESIRRAGRDEAGLPKLAIIRADVRRAHCSNWRESVRFSEVGKWGQAGNKTITVNKMPRSEVSPLNDGNAVVPLIPLNLRPKHALHNYHILWEADWTSAPHDPLLLRRLKGDLWLVLAAWELTAVERAVLEQRATS